MARILQIRGATGDSVILIGERLRNLKAYLPQQQAVIITDTNVSRYYGADFPSNQVLKIGTGEKIKDLDTVRDLYARLLKLGADRSCFIVGIGGGVVCDITGFVASTYLRGVRFGFVSSTLLSQVDASAGGKNGVNFMGYKNMVGVYSQPEWVICDMSLLKTLPKKEVLSGFGEIIKHAAIGDTALFSYLEENLEEAVRLDASVIERLVHDSLLVKSSIVNKDERETGERRKLNFGHTFGHAIEMTTGVSHGEAVSAGMLMASIFSERRGYLPAGDVEKIETLLGRLKLPTRIELHREKMLDALRMDKKRSAENIHFVFLKGIGHAVVEQISFRELTTTMDKIDWPWV